MKNCILLGGSNSVLQYGIASGLEENLEVQRLGLGGTSCIQNLTETIINAEKISNADLIVTESNVNDSFNMHQMNIPFEQMKKQIDDFYRILNSINSNVYVLILPINTYAPHIESKDLIDQINLIHLQNCMKYNFRLIDVASFTNGIEKNDLCNLMPHPRHLHEAMMHQLGINLYYDYIKNPFEKKDKIRNHNLEYIYKSVSDLKFRNISIKQNSVYCDSISKIDSIEFIEEFFLDYEIVAISAWSDGYSLLEIKNKQQHIVKPFSHLKTVSELLQPIEITRDLTFNSIPENIPPTEKTALVVTPKEISPVPTSIVGILIRKKNVTNVNHQSTFAVESRNHLIPNEKPYIKAHISWENHNLIPIKKQILKLEEELKYTKDKIEKIAKIIQS